MGEEVEMGRWRAAEGRKRERERVEMGEGMQTRGISEGKNNESREGGLETKRGRTDGDRKGDRNEER